MSRSVRVTIAGQTLALRTDARSRYVHELAAQVDAGIERARRGGGQTAPTQKLALLAALGLADELQQLRAEHARLIREVRERGQRILRHLDAQADD
jgi:cell division protein ZapA (FtsZ GTPase activity inhibitor)